MMRLRLIALAALGVLALVAVAPEAQAGPTPITSCGQTVTTDAVVTQDLICVGMAGVIVGADGIEIDLGGHVLRGDTSLGHIGIDDSGGWDKVAVKDGVVRNFDAGVNADAADNFTVKNVVASGNQSRGIGILFGVAPLVLSSIAAGNGGDGIVLNGDSATVKGSDAFGNGGDGIRVLGDGASIQSSIGAGNGAAGIHVSGDFASIKSSTASGNSQDGIEVAGGLALIKSSTAFGNGNNGINVGGTAATIEGNTADGNGFPSGASDLVGLGIRVGLFTTPPTGNNTALGNDDPAECSPGSLC